MSKKFIVKSIKMNKIKSTKDLMDLFIWVAKNYPNQANKLFKRYVSYICRHGYSMKTSYCIAARNVGMLADSRGEKDLELLRKFIPAVRQYQ